jgi:fatty-acyl-CoA synthase
MQELPLTVGTLVRHGTSVYGDGVVVTAGEQGTRRASYEELGRRCARLAHALRGLGVTGDQRVGTFGWNNQEHLEAYYTVPSMGAVLHTLNIRLFPEQVAWIAHHAEDRVLIADGSLLPVLARSLPAMSSVDTVLVVGDGDFALLGDCGKQVVRYAEALHGQPEHFDWPALDERSAAIMCYTSGTTGNPKGVVYSHRSTFLHAMAGCLPSALGLATADRVLGIVPFFHACGWGLPYEALVVGADMVLPDRWLQAEPLVAMIEAERPTIAAAVPTVWNDVLHFLHDHPGHDLSSLRKVICGGSAVPRSLMEAFEREFGIPIIQAWGMTETSPLGAVAWPPAGVSDEAAWDYRSTAGRFVCGVEARLVDDAGTVLPSDGKAVGELEVRGPWVAAAYHKEDDPAKFQDGWLRTGDVGTVDPRGYLTLTDRAKDVIKSGGEWISSVELENELMAHPDVLEAAVVGVPDERWSERPLAAVVRTPGSTVSAAALRDWLAARVARWWLPERWVFVEQVPRTGVGKFDKKVLRRAFADGELSVEAVGRAARE